MSCIRLSQLILTMLFIPYGFANEHLATISFTKYLLPAMLMDNQTIKWEIGKKQAIHNLRKFNLSPLVNMALIIKNKAGDVLVKPDGNLPIRAFVMGRSLEAQTREFLEQLGFPSHTVAQIKLLGYHSDPAQSMNLPSESKGSPYSQTLFLSLNLDTPLENFTGHFTPYLNIDPIKRQIVENQGNYQIPVKMGPDKDKTRYDATRTFMDKRIDEAMGPPAVATDNLAVLHNRLGERLGLLLIKRKADHHWAMPGGYAERHEPGETSALRELWEEGFEGSAQTEFLKNVAFKGFQKIATRPQHGKRSFTISPIYSWKITVDADFQPKAGDDAIEFIVINTVEELNLLNQRYNGEGGIFGDHYYSIRDFLENMNSYNKPLDISIKEPLPKFLNINLGTNL